MDTQELINKLRCSKALDPHEVKHLEALKAQDTGGCTEWSCMYHGVRNEAVALYERNYT